MEVTPEEYIKIVTEIVIFRWARGGGMEQEYRVAYRRALNNANILYDIDLSGLKVKQG